MPSGQEYLIAESTRTNHPAYHVDAQAAHTQLALLCMCYINIYLEQSERAGGYDASPPSARGLRIPVNGSDTGPLSSSELHSLHEYVLSRGFYHLAHINPGDRTVLHAIGTLHANARLHPLEWGRLHSRSIHATWPTLHDDFMLFVLIAFAPAPLLCSFIGRTQLKWKDGTNPLIYAASFGKIEHASILLSSGVSLNLRGWDVPFGHRQLLPLEVATRRDDLRMVDLFLTEGSPVPHKLFVSALEQYCNIPARIVSRLLQTDEFVEWAANARDEGLLRALDPARYQYYSPSQQDIDVIQRRLVQLGCDPSTRFNETSLRHAVSAGLVSTVQHMLSQNTPLPPDIILDASCSPTSNVEMIHLCIKMGSDVHTVSSTESTPLHLALAAPRASEDNRWENLQVLVGAGCNPSRCNLGGETPLHLAARKGFISIAGYLLARGAPLPPDILLAASESHKPKMIRLLIDNGADVHAIAPNGDTPLHRVLHYPWPNSEEHLDCVKVLMNSGCNPCLPNALGKTPFEVAAGSGHLLVIQYLYDMLKCPLPPDILLSVVGSAFWGLSPVIKFLIDKGASTRVTHTSGDTLLHLATTPFWDAESLRRIKLLVKYGCDPHACNLAGETPFHFAAREGHIPVMEHLLSLGISVPLDLMLSQFDRAESPRRYSVVRFLLENGGNVHTVAKNGDTLLHLAANAHPEEDALELAKHLVHAGCIECVPNSLQETPLHIAARNGFISFIKYLLSLNTALPRDILLAASTSYSNRTELIRYLVREGADVSVTTTDGHTPLHLLITRGDEDNCLECVKILVGAGCTPRAQNSAGETPLHAAACRGLDNILEYFLSCGIPLPDDILLASGTATTIRFLLSKGLDLRSVAADDITELMHRTLNFTGNSTKDCVECARIFISAGWDPLLKNSAGETALHAAVKKAKVDAVKFFLSQNVPLPSDILLAALSRLSNFPPGVVNRYTRRAVGLTRFLIREGASVSVAASNGNTPLHLAMKRNFILGQDLTLLERLQWELIEILLNAGSDPSARNEDGETPYELAEAKGRFFKQNFLRLVRNSHVHS